MRKCLSAHVDERQPSFVYNPSATVPVVTNNPAMMMGRQNGVMGGGEPNNNFRGIFCGGDPVILL